VETLLKGLTSYLSEFKGAFKIKHSPSYNFSINYLKGLFQCEKKKATCTGISDVVPQTNDQSVNHFISNSKWDYKELMKQIALRCSDFFEKNCDPSDTCLIVDEVGFPKKGKKSACVGRQWLGCLGKQDNGQVAVSLTLCNTYLFSIIQTCLFMPKSWSEDKERREKAKIPESLQFMTKIDMAFEMIEQAVNQNIKFGWIAFDALYGSCFPFLKKLNEKGYTFIGDVKKDTKIFKEEPKVSIPENSGKGGPKYRYPKPESKDIEIQEYTQTLEEKDWEKITFRESTDGNMTCYFHRKQIWVWDDDARELYSYILLIKKSLDGKTVKYSFSNASPQTPTKRLAYMKGQRFFIEQSFKEGKNQTGMGDYQVRSWEGFHKHMAMSMLALNFLMEQKLKIRKELPAITTPDIVEVLKACLPKKLNSVKDVIVKIIQKAVKYDNQIKQRREKANRE
jgi:SRSO17 transposase